MTISIFKLMSAYRGGLHGEAVSSHDDRLKKNSEEEITREAGDLFVNEGQASGSQFKETASCEGRQSQPGKECAAQSTTEGGFGMTTEPSNLPKTGGQVARVLGSLTNDPRITNVLMLVVIAVGMGLHESIQTHACNL